MPRLAGLLLAMAACWYAPRPPPALRVDTRPEPPPPPLQASWEGTCGDEHSGWKEEITITLELRELEGRLAATGTLAFMGRRTEARLQGRRSRGARHTLRGEMTEVDGHGTRWGLILEVEPRETWIRGRFIEILDEGGQEEMCRFVWWR